MSAFGSPVFINPNRAYWLSNVPSDVIHSTIQVQELDASVGRFSTVTIDDLTVSSAVFSTFGVQNLDVSGMYVSSINGNSGFFSSITFASDLSGGVGFVRFHVDASGIQVDGDPIRFDNLVYLTSTINIIQVSTLVDTDIFAQNGFFSTFSSGSISAGLLQANQAYFSSIEVGDLSGYSPQDWSLYPTISGEIIMSTGYNLSNIGATLYFAGQQLATPSDISGIDTWAYHPALSTLRMNNNIITQLSTINFQDGATLTSQTGNNLFYNGQPIQYGGNSNVGQWANFPAVNTVQLAGNNINTSGNLSLTASSNIVIVGQQISTVADNGANIASFADINLVAQNGNRGRINLTANGGFNNGVNGEVNIVANGNTLAGVGSGGLVSITANTPLATPSNLTSAIKLSAAGINSYAGAIPPIGSLLGYNFIYGTLGVNIAAGLPAAFPNVPGTCYLYGTAGVTTSSDFYCPNIYPYWNGLTTPPDLMITGRYIVPNLAQVFVQLSNVKYIYLQGAAQIQNANLVSTVSTVGSALNFTNAVLGSASITSAAVGNQLMTGNIQGSAGSQLLGFSNLSTINLNTSTINGLPITEVISPSTINCVNLNVQSNLIVGSSTIVVSSIYTTGRAAASTLLWNFGIGISTVMNNLSINNIQIADNITGITNIPPIQSRIELFSSIQSGNLSCINLQVSTINGLPWDISGGSGQTNTFSTLITSNITLSSIQGTGGFVAIDTALRFPYPGPGAIDNVQHINLNSALIPNLQIEASTITIAGSGNTFIGPSFSTLKGQVSTLFSHVATISSISTQEITVSSIGGSGGFIGINQALRFPFPGPGSIDNIAQLNLNGDLIPNLLLQASTISLQGNNIQIGEGFSTQKASISSLNASTINGLPVAGQTNNFSTLSTTSLYWTSTLQYSFSNANGSAYQFPIIIDYDSAGNTSTGGCAIRLQGHNLATGAVRNELQLGYDAFTGANYIEAVWPGANLEDLQIRAAQLTINDSSLSTVMGGPAGYAIQNTGRCSLGGLGASATFISGGLISTTALSISSINNYDAGPAYTCALALSTFELYAASTTLMAWSTVTNSANINVSGYDAVVGRNGAYKIGCSFQFLSAGSADEVEFFILKNDSVISQSGGIISVQNNEELVTYVESIEELVNGDKIQWGCFTNSSGVFVSTINGNVIISPAAILTMYKVDS